MEMEHKRKQFAINITFYVNRSFLQKNQKERKEYSWIPYDCSLSVRPDNSDESISHEPGAFSQNVYHITISFVSSPYAESLQFRSEVFIDTDDIMQIPTVSNYIIKYGFKCEC